MKIKLKEPTFQTDETEEYSPVEIALQQLSKQIKIFSKSKSISQLIKLLMLTSFAKS